MNMLFIGKETEKIYNSQQDKKKKPSQPSLQGFAFGTPAGNRKTKYYEIGVSAFYAIYELINKYLSDYILFNRFQSYTFIFTNHAKNTPKNVAGLKKGRIFAAQFNFLTYGNNNIITFRKGGQDNGEI